MTGLQVFQILKGKIGEREAEAFVSYIDENRREMIKEFREIFATKEDLAALRTELSNVRGNLEVKISDVRTDVMRWMFAFFITTLLAILGLYFKK